MALYMERVISDFKKGFHNKTLKDTAKQAALLQAWIWYLEDPTFRKGYIKWHCLEQGAKEEVVEAKKREEEEKGTKARARRRQAGKPQKKTPPGLLGDEPADEGPPGRCKGCALM
jgi:hypothetical protein